MFSTFSIKYSQGLSQKRICNYQVLLISMPLCSLNYTCCKCIIMSYLKHKMYSNLKTHSKQQRTSFFVYFYRSRSKIVQLIPNYLDV